MGSAAGTSIPFFLAHLTPELIGLENEYSRILVDQGWFGLAGWLALLGWLYARPPPARPPAPWRLGVVLMYSVTLACWATAFIGTGMLASIPGTFFLLTQMGVLVTVRDQERYPRRSPVAPRTRPISRLRLPSWPPVGTRAIGFATAKELFNHGTLGKPRKNSSAPFPCPSATSVVRNFSHIGRARSGNDRGF